jgi:hypothetical protein
LKEQNYYAALGSGQRVKVKKKFQKKAKKAYDLCLGAIDAEGTEGQNDKWRKVFGVAFPPRPGDVRKLVIITGADVATNTEEFVEDIFPIDIRYNVELECQVSQNGFRQHFLSDMLLKHVPLLAQKSLDFEIKAHNIPEPFDLYWKVLNRGPIAVARNEIRGQIVADGGRRTKNETTRFQGDHVVECYAVQDGVVVATDRIHVPIRS